MASHASPAKMPRLNHKKARTGCQRCKLRKVKCDEGKPKCAACARHNVACEYIDPQPRRSEGGQSIAPKVTGYTSAFPSNPQLTAVALHEAFADQLQLELRLMRQWTVETCNTFATDPAFWQKQATELGLEYRMILDAMFSLSALHISWPSSQEETNGESQPDFEAPLRREMIMNAQKYLQRALDGHTAAMSTMNPGNVKAIYTASVLLLYYSFFNLGEIAFEPTLPGYDHTFWTRLSGHTHFLCENWTAMDGGEQTMNDWGVLFGRSQPHEAEELFSREQGKPFTELLTFAEEYEAISTHDGAVYQQSVAQLAFIYKSIREGQEPAILNCQRLVAMPSQLGRRFTELLENRQPRALLILAHVFAATKLLSEQIPWLRGIAQRQVPPMQQHVPLAWQAMLKWPMEITFGSQLPNDNVENANEQSLREVLKCQIDEEDQPNSAIPS